MQLDQLLFQIIFSVLGAVMLAACSYKSYQILQLSSYRATEVAKWYKATKYEYLKRYFALWFLSFVVMAIFVASFFSFPRLYYFGALAFFGFGVLFTYLIKKTNKKTPLKFTWRIRRLIGTTFVLNLGLIYGFLQIGALLPIDFYPFVAFTLLLIPGTVTLAHFINLPLENGLRKKYIRRTMRILDNHEGLIKIGITGSFGKTTVKNILTAFLLKKYKAQTTPASFNTPMGICKAVGTGLGDVEVFVAEMGARYTGDIAELCAIVRPTYGVLTGIGNQHLDTFGSIENLHKTKYALIEAVPQNGHAFFNADSEGARMMYGWCKHAPKTMACSGEVSKEGVYYTNQTMTAKGVSFTLHNGEDSVDIVTPLLGKHMAGTLTLCASVALHLGVSLEQIKEASAELKPVPHRLELIDRGDTIVIDDAYNSNVDGARNALEVLSMFEGTKIVVTPGLVELGEEENESNYKVGEFIAEFADYAVLNSSRAKIIAKGAISKGMSEDKIIFADDLADAMEAISKIEADKKVILFENDLPDNFK
ncbi:MAG: UDP-N-acetylmuramoyl-tripeptide--D-alanyl-D-alanine ligase [Firmicutes bacterium]|nr:UDP-N-acetylmuramoyl-tripeptide--D-alanyl-D-alanine ligase [Bacillota bacterium]